jgi:hypothetical protein
MNEAAARQLLAEARARLEGREKDVPFDAAVLERSWGNTERAEGALELMVVAQVVLLTLVGVAEADLTSQHMQQVVTAAILIK